MKSRAAARQSIRGRAFGLCVIGGGATGLGSALDAQLRGLSTVLVDAGDFVSQTSSASTKLVHGGVRYLRQAVFGLNYGQFRMVRKALKERAHLLRAAPYLAHPLELVVPCYSRRQMLFLAMGMKFYDIIAGRAHLSPSRVLSRNEANKTLPRLRMDHVVGAVTYADGQFDDARYGIAMAKTCAQLGCEMLNYARVIGFEHDCNGRLQAARVEDVTDGTVFTIPARSFLNCTGPFADAIRLLANPRMTRRLRISKGIHILLPIAAMNSEAALLIPETEDGRVIFAIPWLGSLLVGTTEGEIEHGSEIVATESEISYLLTYINRYLDTNFILSDVQAAFAGVRPLVASQDAVDTTKLVRDHEVEVDQVSGLVSILGGKWTTYRAMAEDGVNRIERILRRAVTGSSTRTMPLAGSEGFDAGYCRELIVKFEISEPTARHLSQKFGTDATEVLNLVRSEPALARPIYPDSEVLTGEVLYCIREEMAQSIEDLLARRIGIQFHSWKNAVAAAPLVGKLLGTELGWTQQATDRSIDAYIATLRAWANKAAIPFPVMEHNQSPS